MKGGGRVCRGRDGFEGGGVGGRIGAMGSMTAAAGGTMVATVAMLLKQ